MTTYLFVVRVADNQKGIVRARQDIFTCVIPGYRVDLHRQELGYVKHCDTDALIITVFDFLTTPS